MSAPAYKLTNLVKAYKLGNESLPILKGINLEIPQGQFVSIMGPSGSGKSTLLNLLGCLDQPTKGNLSILGTDVGALTDDQMATLRCKRLGFVFQSFHLLPTYDAVSNVALSMVYSNRPNRFGRAKSLLSMVGLGKRMSHKPMMMSGGEKQRVAIARAMANHPQIFLADEPTGALDQNNGQRIMGIIDQLHRKGKTIILVTHDPGVAQQAQRVVRLVDGQIHSDYMVR